MLEMLDIDLEYLLRENLGVALVLIGYEKGKP